MDVNTIRQGNHRLTHIIHIYFGFSDLVEKSSNFFLNVGLIECLTFSIKNLIFQACWIKVKKAKIHEGLNPQTKLWDYFYFCQQKNENGGKHIVYEAWSGILATKTEMEGK